MIGCIGLGSLFFLFVIVWRVFICLLLLVLIVVVVRCVLVLRCWVIIFGVCRIIWRLVLGLRWRGYMVVLIFVVVWLGGRFGLLLGLV